eukprot:TRINITY_DN82494_c0_g1_i1.p1 TRINITY_DN82494_c0_g1~~TRINITY_DN82494_c0_g1_i1.p1  ORF type:complete len:111 (+),score=15.74 TRINITY_DN82494_c0_g1_i1:25-333(+)
MARFAALFRLLCMCIAWLALERTMANSFLAFPEAEAIQTRSSATAIFVVAAPFPAAASGYDLHELGEAQRILLGFGLLLMSILFHAVVAPYLQRLYFERERT